MAKRKQKEEIEDGVWIDPSYEQRFSRLQGVKGSVHDDQHEDDTPDMSNRSRSRYPLVRPEPKPEVVKIPAGELNRVEHVLNVPPTATTHIEVRTNSVDQSKGYLIRTIPLLVSFAVGGVIVGVFWWDIPLFSLTAFTVFWLTLVGAWLLSFFWDTFRAPESIGMFEAFMKWHVIRREQTKRWDYYERRDGRK